MASIPGCLERANCPIRKVSFTYTINSETGSFVEKHIPSQRKREKESESEKIVFYSLIELNNRTEKSARYDSIVGVIHKKKITC